MALDGPTAATRFGQGVESLGDINGYGIDDMAITTPFLNNNITQSGAIFVLFGQVGGIDSSFDDTSLNGANGSGLMAILKFRPNVLLVFVMLAISIMIALTRSYFQGFKASAAI